METLYYIDKQGAIVSYTTFGRDIVLPDGVQFITISEYNDKKQEMFVANLPKGGNTTSYIKQALYE